MHLVLLALALLVPTVASAAPPASTPAAPAPKRAPGLVFIANSGLEDLQTLSNSLKHAKAAQESGYLDQVVWLVYGRAIVLLDPGVKAVPASLREDLAAAKASGVRLVACAQALDRNGIDRAGVDPTVEVVPNAMNELGRLIADGYEVVRY
jgi:intracellular sulfur oxidation DsrE/DsrF family protein